MTHTNATTQGVSQGNQFGRFKIERLLGEGGFASVYLALDPKLNRRVALKIPKPAMLESNDAKVRFEREARAAAMLSHPSIVPVFECGELNGQNYIASAYCQGQTLGAWIRRQPRSIDLITAAKIIAELAEAVGHAHQRGIVHRDLKPANVLVDSDNQIVSPNISFGDPGLETETIAPSTKRDVEPESQNEADTILPGTTLGNEAEFTRIDAGHKTIDAESETDHSILGRLRITDFGLAKSTNDNQELTVEGAIMGTPSYMSPEQASGSPNAGPTSDIFTLGTMLYELITNQLPFRRDSTLNTMMAISEDPLPAIATFRNGVPKDLEAICQKCLEKDSTKRYESAYELATDLRSWIDGKPVNARIAGPFEKFIKLCKRNQGITAAIGAALMSLSLGLAGTTWSWRNSEANLERANFEFARAEENLVIAEKAAAKEKRARESAEQVAVYMTSVFRLPDPTADGRNVKVLDILDDARERLDDSFGEDPEVRMELMLAIGDCYFQLGQFEDSLSILDDANSFRLETFADNRHMEAEIRDKIAKSWVETRELDKAIAAFGENLTLAETLEGIDSQMYATTERNLAAALMYNEDFATALPILEQFVERTKDLELTPETKLGAQNMLAACLEGVGRVEEATTLFEEVLEAEKEQLGVDHPSCLETANNLAVRYSRNGEYEKAATQQEFILEQSYEIHGDEHPITIRCLNNLAMTRFKMGEFDEATPLYREAWRLCKEKLGRTHINTVSIGMGLANSLIAEGEIEEAIPILKSGRRPMIKALGHANGRVQLLLDSLGKSYESTGDLPKAIEVFEEMLKGYDGNDGDPTVEYTVRATISRLMLENGQGTEAEERAIELYDLVAELEEPSEFNKLLGHLTAGLAKVGNSKMNDASQYLEYVLSRRVKFSELTGDEKGIVKPMLAQLVKLLEQVDSNSTLLDPEEWEAIRVEL